MQDTGEHILEREGVGHTGLMWAALYGDTKAVTKLLARGVDVNAKDGEGRTALMFAVINMHRDTVGVLLKHGADVNARAKDGGTALMLAASCGDPEIVKALLNTGAEPDGNFVTSGKNAVTLAAEKGHTAALELIKKVVARKSIGATAVLRKEV